MKNTTKQLAVLVISYQKIHRMWANIGTLHEIYQFSDLNWRWIRVFWHIAALPAPGHRKNWKHSTWKASGNWGAWGAAGERFSNVFFPFRTHWCLGTGVHDMMVVVVTLVFCYFLWIGSFLPLPTFSTLRHLGTWSQFARFRRSSMVGFPMFPTSM